MSPLLEKLRKLLTLAQLSKNEERDPTRVNEARTSAMLMFKIAKDNGIEIEFVDSRAPKLSLRPQHSARSRAGSKVSVERASEIRAMLERIESFAVLSAGWSDGQGKPASRSATELARDFLTRLLIDDLSIPRPAVFPTPDGGVQAEWSVGHWSIEALFPADGSDVCVEALNTETTSEREHTFQDPRELRTWLQSLQQPNAPHVHSVREPQTAAPWEPEEQEYERYDFGRNKPRTQKARPDPRPYDNPNPEANVAGDYPYNPHGRRKGLYQDECICGKTLDSRTWYGPGVGCTHVS